MKSIAIDFGGSAIKLALISDGNIIKRDNLPAYSENGLAPRLKDVEESVFKMLNGDDIKSYSGVGIATTGAVNPKTKKIMSLYGKNEDLENMDLSSWCENIFDLPMTIEMDSKVALLGEMHYGVGQGYQDVVILTFGTGIGTAAAVDGKILSGRNNVVGLLSSHLVINVDGRKCTCPNYGCMEASACGWALEGLVYEHPEFLNSGLATEEDINFKTLAKWYKKGDRTASDIVHYCVRQWRAGILNMIHAYVPALVILSGGIMKFEGLYEMLTDGQSERIWDCCGEVEFALSKHPEDSVLYGTHQMVKEIY